MRGLRTCCLLVVLLAALATGARGQVELPSVIGDNMVLQRETDAAIWGWDEPGTAVAVTFRGRTISATAGEEGAWTARVPTGDAGGPFELSIEGSEARTLSNVMVGEVWVAGGQSNMWWAVSNCDNAREEIQAADHPGVRLYDANTAPREGGWIADEPQRTVDARWEVARPGAIGGWAGTAYFFARELHRELDVPVGIVHVAVPGSAIEPWLSPEFARRHLPNVTELYECRARLYPEELKEHEARLAEWEEERASAEAEGREPPQRPRPPRDPATARSPSRLFNGMVAPVAPFSTRGFIWWQGESNQGRTLHYRVLFPGLIQDWREVWGADDAPFLYVELANFWDKQTAPVEDSAWPAVRDAQREALRLPGVRMACVIDILPDEDARNIHPPNKQLAGKRLALVALADAYGREEVAWSGPVMRDAEFEDGAAVVTFDHVGGGLVAEGGELEGFALAGPDRRWHWAEARIEGPTVVLTSEDVPQPVAARYGWAANPIGILRNAEGLPAPPFRTDRWLLRLNR